LNLEFLVRNWRAAFVGCSSVLVLACAKQETEEFARQLSVRDAWARPADSGAMTAVYFTLANGGPNTDTLLSTASDDAASAMLHISTQRGSMMHMSPVSALPVPGEDSVSFRPLGAHVMLTGLVRPLVEGDSVSATLAFASGRTVRVVAGVRRP
jgi:copper(I)-binding protein